MSVWVALSHPGDVQLRVFEGNAESPGPVVTPRRVGTNLWVAVLTVGGVTAGEFAAGTTYEYTVTSATWPAARSPDWSDFALAGRNRPSFQGLPASLDAFRVLHTSCRRPHANKRDALANALVELQGANRPHLLILSGDQIYADDVATVQLAQLREVDAALVNVDDTPVLGALPALGARQQPSEAFGLTSGEAPSHAWTLGEFYGLYLLAWSDVLWHLGTLPPLADADPGEVDPGVEQEGYDAEVANLELFRAALPAVRRVLANAPTLMILDDHEVTDDWNLDYQWITSVYGTAGGRRVVANGLLAYMLFQHWGNVPARVAAAGSPEAQVLAAAAAPFTPPPAGAAASPITAGVETLLGMPQVPLGAAPLDLRNMAAGVRYDFRLGPADGYPLHVVMLDERTARRLPSGDGRAGRVAPTALDLQWPSPQDNEADTPTLLVAAAPVLGLNVIEHVLQPLLGLKEGGPASFDFEGWTAHQPTFENLLARIDEWRRVVILSGDVHFGYTKTLVYERPPGDPDSARAVQFVASGAKHSVALTVLLHLLGDAATKLGVIRTRTFRGYQQLNQAQRNALESVPAGELIYDDAADVLLGRVLRAGQEQPAVLAEDVAVLYGLGAGDWTYTIEHVDDEAVPAVGNLAAALAATPPAWSGWNRANSIATVRGLRASDLVRIGRVTSGLPQLAVITFPAGPQLAARQELRIAHGEAEPGATVTTATQVVLT